MASIDNDSRIVPYIALNAELQENVNQGESTAAHKDGEKSWSDTMIIFRYADLPVELQDLVMEAAILGNVEKGERLSHLAAVNRKWQERVEKHIFAQLGEFPVPSGYWFPVPSPFKGRDLHDFSRIVVGKRRAMLRHIHIDFILDDDIFDDVEPVHVHKAWTGARLVNVVNHSLTREPIHCFAYYLEKLFNILSAWDPTGAGQSYLDVEIRVRGRLSHAFVSESLPSVRVIRNFGFYYDPFGRMDVSPDIMTCYVPPNCVNRVLRQLPQLHSAAIDVQLPDPSSSLARRYDLSFNTWNVQAKDFITELPKATSLMMKELVLKNPVIEFEMRFPDFHRSSGESSKDEDCFEAICILGHRLEQLTLNYTVSVEKFLAHVVCSPSSLSWHHLRHLTLRDYTPCSPPEFARTLDLMRSLIVRMRVLEIMDVKLQEFTLATTHLWTAVEIKLEFIKSTNKEDHALLTIKGPAHLSETNIDAWRHTIQEIRGVPLHVSTTKGLMNSQEYEHDSEDEDKDEEQEDQDDDSEEDGVDSWFLKLLTGKVLK